MRGSGTANPPRAPPSLVFRRGWDPNDSIKNLSAFIRDEFDRPRDSRQNWRDHVMNWHDGGRGRNNVIYLTYEKLISNPRATLFRVITEMTGQEPDPWVVEKTVEKYYLPFHQLKNSFRAHFSFCIQNDSNFALGCNIDCKL